LIGRADEAVRLQPLRDRLVDRVLPSPETQTTSRPQVEPWSTHSGKPEPVASSGWCQPGSERRCSAFRTRRCCLTPRP